jgi:hypothetical protein
MCYTSALFAFFGIKCLKYKSAALAANFSGRRDRRQSGEGAECGARSAECRSVSEQLLVLSKFMLEFDNYLRA